MWEDRNISCVRLATNCYVVLDLILAFRCCFNSFVFHSHVRTLLSSVYRMERLNGLYCRAACDSELLLNAKERLLLLIVVS